MDFTNFFSTIQHFGMGFLFTIDPTKGEGLTESVLAFLFVGVVLYMAIAGQQIPDFLKDIVIMIAGLYFGFQSGKNAKVIQT